jgi:hypothetical protein
MPDPDDPASISRCISNVASSFGGVLVPNWDNAGDAKRAVNVPAVNKTEYRRTVPSLQNLT